MILSVDRTSRMQKCSMKPREPGKRECLYWQQWPYRMSRVHHYHWSTCDIVIGLVHIREILIIICVSSQKKIDTRCMQVSAISNNHLAHQFCISRAEWPIQWAWWGPRNSTSPNARALWGRKALSRTRWNDWSFYWFFHQKTVVLRIFRVIQHFVFYDRRLFLRFSLGLPLSHWRQNSWN